MNHAITVRTNGSEFLKNAFKTFGPCKWYISVPRVAALFGIIMDAENNRSGAARLGFEMRCVSIFACTCVFVFVATGT